MDVRVSSDDNLSIVCNTCLPTGKNESIVSSGFTLFELNCNLEFTRSHAGRNALLYVHLLTSGTNAVTSERFVVITCLVKINGEMSCIETLHVCIEPSPFRKLLSLFYFKDIEKEFRTVTSMDKITFVFTFLSGNFARLDEPSRKVRRDNRTSASLCDEACVNNLGADLQKLLGGAYHDLELKCGDRSLPAHKAILSTRSEVFESMLDSKNDSGRTGVVTVDDMEFPVLEKFLRYLYSGSVPEMTVEVACKLMEAGNTYAVGSLMRRCSTFLLGHLTTGNACDFLVLADRFDDRQFKESVIAYIQDNEVPKKYDGWLKFCSSRPMLANEVLNQLILRR